MVVEILLCRGSAQQIATNSGKGIYKFKTGVLLQKNE
jgi:hypothetical protein